MDIPLIPLRLCALGLRNEADESLRLAARPRTVPAARRTGSPALNRLLGELDRRAATVDRTGRTEAAVLVELCRAEGARAAGKDRTGDWIGVVDGWQALGRPHAAAYGLWRAAESAARAAKESRRTAGGDSDGQTWRDQAIKAAREAHELCRQLGATPLGEAVAELARGARIDLTRTTAAPRPRTLRSAGDPAGLTEREREVLALVAAGWTNRKIATELFITEKTAGVHVSNILRKLGVPRRGEAASHARTLGLGA